MARWWAWRCRSPVGPGPDQRPRRRARRPLDLDVVGAEVGEEAAGDRAGPVRRHLEDAQPGERAAAVGRRPSVGARDRRGRRRRRRARRPPAPGRAAAPGVAVKLYGWPGKAMSPSRSHQSRAASCSSASTPAPSTTGVTATRSSWPSSTISATVLSCAHSWTASKIARDVGVPRRDVDGEVLVAEVGPLDHHEQLVLGDDAHHVDPAVGAADEVDRLAGEQLRRTPPTTTPARRGR